ncbi:hypothetical protein [endosymbiont GvMRE of Glomus versiforme]|uniref:hypothetical protein n=1 Tax=endosymbiont GvMRE of Glomus versiforme TaxID=2039283 RepID=UPI000EE852ED|nr:hypothetical protein [endosymbiont GvMRE of Glomus versiforme]RHZ35753.1 hypothetical protein GvMRE_Ic6g55 [endosymbiont GvMRE of Glomus versiforme]
MPLKTSSNINKKQNSGFKDKKAEALWKGEWVSEYQKIKKPSRKKFSSLKNVSNLNYLYLIPSNHTEALKGKNSSKLMKEIKKRCLVCQRFIEINFRCAYCGNPFHGLEENWNQNNPCYTDEALRKFAKEAVEYLLKDDYKKTNLNYDKNTVRIDYETKIEDWGSWSWEGQTEEEFKNKNVLCLPIKSLRNKRECLDTVAHETAHASSQCWDARIKHWIKPSKNYLSGHHPVFQKVYQEYKQKLRKKFPDYKWD